MDAPQPGQGGGQQPPPKAAAAATGNYPDQNAAGNYPPAGGYYYPPQAAPQPARPPLVSIVSPDDIKKIRKMQVINFAATMLQLGAAVAVICIVRYQLSWVTISNIPFTQPVTYVCLMSTPYWWGMCDYAYSLAAISIFWCFMLSLMQCLTMDCCGAGRLVEALFDFFAFAWWFAGGVVLAIRANEANQVDLPKEAARNAVVAMCFLAAFFFLVLLVTNVVLIKRLGKAYKALNEQDRIQAATAYAVAPPGYASGAAPGGVQMAPAGYGQYGPQYGQYGPGPYGPGPNAPPAGQQPQMMPPAGYPAVPSPAPVATGPNAV